MPSSLLLPEGYAPTNLHLNAKTDRARYVSSDVFHIAERLREIDERLYILELERDSQEGQRFGYAIMERCPDGVHRLVLRCSREALDQRQLDRIGAIMSVDLHTRLKILDAEREKWEAEQREDQLEEAYERIGGPMLRELAATGFVQRAESFRPMNRTARRHGRRMR